MAVLAHNNSDWVYSFTQNTLILRAIPGLNEFGKALLGNPNIVIQFYNYLYKLGFFFFF